MGEKTLADREEHDYNISRGRRKRSRLDRRSALCYNGGIANVKAHIGEVLPI